MLRRTTQIITNVRVGSVTRISIPNSDEFVSVTRRWTDDGTVDLGIMTVTHDQITTNDAA